MDKGPEENTAAMLGGSELCEPHPTPMLSLLLFYLLKHLIAQHQLNEIYKVELVLSQSEADTSASLPSHLPGTTTISHYDIIRFSLPCFHYQDYIIPHPKTLFLRNTKSATREIISWLKFAKKMEQYIKTKTG